MIKSKATYPLLLLLLITFTRGFSQEERLIIFTQAEEDQFFVEKVLPEIKALAEQEGIQLDELMIDKGVPSGITSTPAIIFNNSKGRFIYSGRYVEVNTIKNFIRTSRVTALGQLGTIKENCLVKQVGKTQLGISIKLTDLKKESNDFTNDQMLANDIRSMVFQSIQNYSLKPKVKFLKTDRLFYLDIHPYLGKNNQLFLSYALFSQFDCINPIYKNFSKPIYGRVEDKAQLLKQLGDEVTTKIEGILKSSIIGDAISPISDKIPEKSWEQLGFTISKTTYEKVDFTAMADKNIPNSWMYLQAVSDKVPALLFKFKAPLDRYAGEFKTMNGSMQLKTDGQIDRISFEVDVKSMTMGMASLDEKVLKSYLKVKKFPKATFKSTKISAHRPLEWGQTISVEMGGELQIMKYKRPVQVEALLTPSIDDTGKSILIAQVHFGINITQDYAIKGPDGPKEASEQMELDMNFIMESEQN